jgi:phosphatidylglycerol:prolipoprotein diacylglycerol transferase
VFPKLIEFGDFFLPTYGVFVALGFLAGLWVASRLSRLSGLDPDKIANLCVYSALAGLAGAKLLMFAADFDHYIRNPGEIFSLTTLQSGGIFYGGLIAALATGVFLFRRSRIPVLPALDAIVPGIAIGQALGRVGCFAAGCCWGVECDRSWAVTFTNPESHRLFGVPLNVPLHPTQVYEALSGFAIFGILWWLFHRPRPAGLLLAAYLLLASTARFTVEFFRAHDQPGPFGDSPSTAQFISAALFLAGTALLLRLHRGPSQV